MKCIDLAQLRLLMDNGAVKLMRIQRAPMEQAWNLVFCCPASEYALQDAGGGLHGFSSADEVIDLLHREGVAVSTLTIGVKP